MPSICFLTSNAAHRATTIIGVCPTAFDRRGLGRRRAPITTTCVCRAPACALRRDDAPLDRFDLIWPIGLGVRESFFDRMQLLLIARSASLRHERATR